MLAGDFHSLLQVLDKCVDNRAASSLLLRDHQKRHLVTELLRIRRGKQTLRDIRRSIQRVCPHHMCYDPARRRERASLLLPRRCAGRRSAVFRWLT